MVRFVFTPNQRARGDLRVSWVLANQQWPRTVSSLPAISPLRVLNVPPIIVFEV